MRGRTGERREIILAYIDRARRGPDEADAGNKNFWTLKTEQKRRKQSAGPWKMSHGKATSDQSESREKRINESRNGMFLSKAKRNQATKGIRRMPWRHEPMKDAISCEKPRGTANKYRSVGVRMGKPGSRYGLSPCKGREPGELKHLSSRRKRNQTRCPQ